MLSHFDAVVYYTGDDLVPQALGQGVTDTELPPRRDTVAANGTFNLTGSQHLTTSGVRNAQMLRNYMNEGGKVVFSGRNGWVQQTSTGTGLMNYSNYTWWQEPVYGFNYPPNQEGDDDRPHTAFFRELDISNDWGQWWLGIGARQGGVGRSRGRSPHRRRRTPSSGRPRRSCRAVACSTGCGRSRSTPAWAPVATIEPTQDPVTGLPDPRAKTPTRLRSISSVTLQRPFRQERVEADYAGAPTANGGGDHLHA